MLKVISDINVIAINFWMERMISEWMLIISNRYGIKCLIDLLQLEPSSVMLKVISDIMTHWYDLWNTIVIVINFCTGKKIICVFMFIIAIIMELNVLVIFFR